MVEMVDSQTKKTGTGKLKLTHRITAHEPGPMGRDEVGYYRIVLDREKKLITAELYSHDHRMLHVVEGPTARALSHTIIEEGMVTTLEHAAYLGRELARAEIALNDPRPYIQSKT